MKTRQLDSSGTRWLYVNDILNLSSFPKCAKIKLITINTLSYEDKTQVKF